ncbi:probable G-protein coupled receptor 150 isoform X2 [Peromyscus californicus insignis]|uniref:probable G-protein coupled receptor 150 isoform X2 n=1 Tax=Peromyscus californicus insignis TaxID=564181 RepID=UPI0022A73A78|nr:probable G-protein coupled receptor 150 isoform X2 [Peromyscus californicus insignis]
MEAPFSPSVLPPAPNLSLSILPSWSLNLTSGQATSVPGPQPPPRRPPSHPIHLVFMGIILVTAVAGNTTVLCRLCGGSSRPWPGPKRRKMDFLLVQLAAADLYACGGTALSQLAWELLGDPRPALGDLACRFSQLLQASGRGASAHLVALIALERQLAVRRPQGPQLPARALAALGWLLALLLALPPTFVVRWGAPPPPAASAWPGEHRCGGIFAPLPRWHLQIYTLYEAIVGFAAPVAIMGVSCGHLLCVWWQRGSQAPVAGAPWSASPARAPLPSALPRAKVQSLKMSLSLALLFVGCELPYFAARLAAAWSSEPTGGRLWALVAATEAPGSCVLRAGGRSRDQRGGWGPPGAAPPPLASPPLSPRPEGGAGQGLPAPAPAAPQTAVLLLRKSLLGAAAETGLSPWRSLQAAQGRA